MTISWARGGVARRLLAGWICVVFSACSFATVQRARPPAEVEDPRVLDTCTTAPEAPVADTLLAGAGLIGGYAWMLYALLPEPGCTATSTTRCSSRGNPGSGLAAMAAGGVFLGSAIYGYVSTAKCRHRIAAGQRCANGDVRTCQKLSPGWTPPPGWRAPGAVLEPMPASGPRAAPPPSPPPWNAQPAPVGSAPAPAAPAAPSGADAR